MENEVAVLVNENEVKDHRKEYFEQIKNNGKYEINKELATALLAIEFGNKNIIISGSAGTGKSTFIELFQEYTRKSYGLFAPTGVASLNIGGVTLHSFFGLSIGIADKFDFNRSDEKREIINKLDVFIIDEISMVRSDVIDAIDYQLKYFTGNFDQPFGGKKMVFIGDLFQLPPIVQKGTLEEKIILEAYSTPWFFGADIGEFVFIIFEKIYRQNSKELISTLNRIRVGTQTDDDLKYLNKRTLFSSLPDKTIFLTTTRAKADEKNFVNLNKIQDKSFYYSAKVNGEFPETIMPTKTLLELKIGAQVMFVKNHKDGSWFNGTIGRIVGIEVFDGSDIILVEDEYGELKKVSIEKWENYKYVLEFDRPKKKIVGEFYQYPLILAWAITIHKSQSKTYENIYIDLGRGMFAAGQAYVALSRCKTLEGIHLSRPLRKSDIIVDNDVRKFFLKNFFCAITIQNVLNYI